MGAGQLPPVRPRAAAAHRLSAPAELLLRRALHRGPARPGPARPRTSSRPASSTSATSSAPRSNPDPRVQVDPRAVDLRSRRMRGQRAPAWSMALRVDGRAPRGGRPSCRPRPGRSPAGSCSGAPSPWRRPGGRAARCRPPPCSARRRGPPVRPSTGPEQLHREQPEPRLGVASARATARPRRRGRGRRRPGPPGARPRGRRAHRSPSSASAAASTSARGCSPSHASASVRRSADVGRPGLLGILAADEPGDRGQRQLRCHRLHHRVGEVAGAHLEPGRARGPAPAEEQPVEPWPRR